MRPRRQRPDHFVVAGDHDLVHARRLHPRRSADPDDLEIWKLRTSGLPFQLKAVLGDRPDKDKDKAFKQCVTCPGMVTAFLSDTERGLALVRARVQAAPDDVAARFFLGKINLNYVWLQLGVLGRRTGWDEDWEARRSLYVRERNVPAAVAVARGLAVDFPRNPELARYLDAHEPAVAAPQAPEMNWPPAAAASTVER